MQNYKQKKDNTEAYFIQGFILWREMLSCNSKEGKYFLLNERKFNAYGSGNQQNKFNLSI